MSTSNGRFWSFLSHVPLRALPSDRSECVNEVVAGEIVHRIAEGEGNWVEVELADGYRGWMDCRQLKPVNSNWEGVIVQLSALSSPWDGVAGGWLPAGATLRWHNGKWFLGEDVVHPIGQAPQPYSGTMLDWALSMRGAPYHWGGRTGWGFDCSGLVSLAASLCGHKVPRDASEQAKVGQVVPRENVQCDDIAFFQSDSGNITHVGICDGTGNVLHASGHVRLDRLDGDSLVRHDDLQPSHQLAFIRRWGR